MYRYSIPIPMKTPLSYIEISKKALTHNVAVFRKLLGRSTKIAAVVKANAYGHGQQEATKVLAPLVDYFQVDDVEELRLLRRMTKKPVLVLGYVAEGDLLEAVSYGAILGVYNIEQLKAINKIGQRRKKKIAVHVKIDALLGRQGVLPSELDAFIQELKKLKYISVGGVYAHFANIEDTRSFVHPKKQIAVYEEALNLFRKHGFENVQKHISATSGVLAYESHGKNDIVRVGLGLYGMWPSLDLRKKYESSALRLQPVMRWVSHVAQVKLLPKNHPVGYGLTYITKKPTKVAVVPQGYSDGYDRGLSNIGEVLISGKRCRVLGRVAMNMFVVDATSASSVRTESEVVLLGRQGHSEITAEQIAAQLGTINYEVTTRVSPLLKRIIK